MINIDEQILDYLKQLHMPTMRGCYQQIADCARSESFSYEQYLLELLKLECEARRQNRIARNLRASKLPTSKTLAGQGGRAFKCFNGRLLFEAVRKCIGLRQSRQRQNSPVMRHRSSADRTGQKGSVHRLQPAGTRSAYCQKGS